jgi:mannose-6-phosphate isomerase class I
MCIDGAFEIEYNRIISVKKGDTVLIPAAMDYVINGKASILEIYIS